MDKNRILDLLERILWSKYEGPTNVCPKCYENFLKYGHTKNCEFGLALKDLGTKEEVKFQD